MVANPTVKTEEVTEALNQMIANKASFNTGAEASEFVAGFNLNPAEKVTLIESLYTGQTKANLAHWDEFINKAVEPGALERQLDFALSRIIEDAATSPETRLANRAAFEQSTTTASKVMESLNNFETPLVSATPLDQQTVELAQKVEELRELTIKNIQFFAENPAISENLVEQGVYAPENKEEFLNGLNNMDEVQLVQVMDELKIAYGNLDQGNFKALTNEAFAEIDALKAQVVNEDFAEIDTLKAQVVEEIMSNDVLLGIASSELGVETLTAKEVENQLGGMSADTLRMILTTLEDIKQNNPDINPELSSLETEALVAVAAVEVTELKEPPTMQNAEPVSVAAPIVEMVSIAPVDMSASNTDPLAPSEVPDYYAVPTRREAMPGDTLSEIVNCHFLSVAGIELDSQSIKAFTEIVAEANRMDNIHLLKAGDTIIIPSFTELAAAYEGHKINTEQWFTPETLNATADCSICEVSNDQNSGQNFTALLTSPSLR